MTLSPAVLRYLEACSPGVSERIRAFQAFTVEPAVGMVQVNDAPSLSTDNMLECRAPSLLSSVLQTSQVTDYQDMPVSS